VWENPEWFNADAGGIYKYHYVLNFLTETTLMGVQFLTAN
jgi:hypothetical protein